MPKTLRAVWLPEENKISLEVVEGVQLQDCSTWIAANEISEKDLRRIEVSGLNFIAMKEFSLPESEKTDLSKVALDWGDEVSYPTAEQIAEAVQPPPSFEPMFQSYDDIDNEEEF